MHSFVDSSMEQLFISSMSISYTWLENFDDTFIRITSGNSSHSDLEWNLHVSTTTKII